MGDFFGPYPRGGGVQKKSDTENFFAPPQWFPAASGPQTTENYGAYPVLYQVPHLRIPCCSGATHARVWVEQVHQGASTFPWSPQVSEARRKLDGTNPSPSPHLWPNHEQPQPCKWRPGPDGHLNDTLDTEYLVVKCVQNVNFDTL